MTHGLPLDVALGQRLDLLEETLLAQVSQEVEASKAQLTTYQQREKRQPSSYDHSL